MTSLMPSLLSSLFSSSDAVAAKPLVNTASAKAAPACPPLPPSLSLAPGGVMRLQDCHGRRIQVQSGRLWLTEAGDTEDHFITPGQTRVLCREGLSVIEADGPQPAVFVII